MPYAYFFKRIKSKDTVHLFCQEEYEILSNLNFDYNKLHQKMKDTVNYNQKHAFDIARNQYGIPEIICNDKYYKDTLLTNVKQNLDLLESKK